MDSHDPKRPRRPYAEYARDPRPIFATALLISREKDGTILECPALMMNTAALRFKLRALGK